MSSRSPRPVAELRHDAVAHLDKFTNSSGLYAFATYDQADVHSGPITAADVLMANLLGLRLGARDVIPLFAENDTPPPGYAGHSMRPWRRPAAFRPLEDCDEDQVEMPGTAWLASLAPAYPIRGQPMPLTRVADILIWCHGQR